MKRLIALLTVCILLLCTVSTAFAASSISLVKPDDVCYGTWKRVSSKRYSFRFEVKNTSPTKTVRSFDVAFYTTDGYSEQNCALTTVTIDQKIKPYEKVYTNEFFLENAADVCKVYTAVTGVRYTNGTSEYLDKSAYSYTSWTINKDILEVDTFTYPREASTTSSNSSSSSSSILNKFNQTSSLKTAPMKIDMNGDAVFKLVSTKRISMRFDVRNNSSTKTVRSYEVTFYTCDDWGNQTSGKETVTLTQKIKPYQTELCPEIFVTNQSEVYQINAAITRVRYTDGTSETVSSPEYVTWNLRR
nr:hypothetical protein [Clostridia bacterium]